MSSDSPATTANTAVDPSVPASATPLSQTPISVSASVPPTQASQIPAPASQPVPQSTPAPGTATQPTPAQQAEFLNSMPLPNPPENVAATSGGAPPKTLWMGDLEPWWDDDYIVNLWKNLNKAVLVKVIKPKKNSVLQHIANNGANLFNHSGYCFVEFETYEEAKEALALNGSIVPGSNNKIFRLNWASGATLASQIPQTPEYSIFVGDLSPSTTEAHLLALFQTSFKSVKTVRVMTDPATGSSRCFGFVRFTDEEERRRALLEMNGVWLAGRPIRVALATPKHSNNSNQNNGYGQQNDYNDRGLDQNQMFLPPPIPPPGGMPYYPPHFNQPSPPQQQAYNDPTNTTVFVGGLANGVPEETLITLFEPFGAIVQVKIPQGKGCGFVKFAKREDAEQAIAGMQGFIIGGSRVRLSWGRSNHNNNMNQQMLLRSQVGISGSYDGYGVPPPVNSLGQGLPAEFAPPPQGIPPMYYTPASSGDQFTGDDSGRYVPQFSNAPNGPGLPEFQAEDGIPEDNSSSAAPTL